MAKTEYAIPDLKERLESLQQAVNPKPSEEERTKRIQLHLEQTGRGGK